MENKTKSPKNPCVRNCGYNDDQICTACFRTQKEVYYWGDYSDSEKIEILKKTGERRREIKKNSNKG